MRENLIGQKFGRLTVIDVADDIVSESGRHTAMWKCLCDCGNETVVRGKCLKSGDTKSCGCLQREEVSRRFSKHHGFGTRLYAIWDSMRQRCNNPNNGAYHNYGGRGIKICKEWNDYDAFRTWAYQAGYDDGAPRGSLTLDRIDVDSEYSPENCRWVSMGAQSLNKRETLYLEYEGKCKPLIEWAREKNIKYATAWRRYSRGWAPERILSAI